MKTSQSKNEASKLNFSTPSSSKPKFINTDYLMEISFGSADFITVFLKTFKEEAQRSLAYLQKQWHANDFVFIERTAHSMKPTGTYVGSHALTLLVSLLEKAAHNRDSAEVSRLVPEVQMMT